MFTSMSQTLIYAEKRPGVVVPGGSGLIGSPMAVPDRSCLGVMCSLECNAVFEDVPRDDFPQCLQSA